VLLGNTEGATTAFEQALTILHAVGDRRGEAVCCWHYGLFLAHQGEREHALPLLRESVAYEAEIGHAKAAEHAALLALLEAGEELPAELSPTAGQHAAGSGAETNGRDDADR
jgi:hypothetical protein